MIIVVIIISSIIIIIIIIIITIIIIIIIIIIIYIGPGVDFSARTAETSENWRPDISENFSEI